MRAPPSRGGPYVSSLPEPGCYRLRSAVNTGNTVKKRVATMPDYEKLADEVRALIASRAFHTPEAIEDLLQLAAWYEARANQRSAAGESSRPAAHVSDSPAHRTNSVGVAFFHK